MPNKMLSLKVRLEPVPVRDYHRRLRLVTALLEQEAGRRSMPPIETQSAKLRAAVATQPSSNRRAQPGGQQ